MADALWLLPWCIAGLPLPSILVKLRPRRLRLLAPVKGAFSHLGRRLETLILPGSGHGFCRPFHPDGGNGARDSGAMRQHYGPRIRIGCWKTYPTKTYVRTKMVCAACREYKHDDCTNLRMLDGFETNFKSKDGRYRPVCCCGQRISSWLEMAI